VSTRFSKILKQHQVKFDLKKVKTPPEVASVISRHQFEYPTIAVYGGDGTVVAAINALVGNIHTKLLILPGGTANIIAAELKLSNKPEDVLTSYVLGHYKVTNYDIASANKKPFVFDLHTGLWHQAISHSSRTLKKRLGQLAYGITAIKSLRTLQKHAYHFEIDGRAVRTSAYLMMVANHGHQNLLGVRLFPSKHRRGKVQLVVLKSINPINLMIWLFARATYGGSTIVTPLKFYRGFTIKVIKSPKLAMYDDQELKMSLPLTVRGGIYDIPVIVPSRPRPQLSFSRFKLLLLRLVERIRKTISGRPNYDLSRVAPGLYVGGSYRKSAYKLFKKWGVTTIVNMRTTTPKPAETGFTILNLKTKDWHAPTIANLKEGVECIKKVKAKGEGVYIHCRQGEGRAPTMAAAYLIAEGYELQDALEHLKKSRPMSHPNTKQITQLNKWQKIVLDNKK